MEPKTAPAQQLSRKFRILIHCTIAVLLLTGGTLFADSRPVYHRVRSGDTLSELAVKYRTSVSRLKKWNGIRNGSSIRIGQRLKVGWRKVKSKQVSSSRAAAVSSASTGLRNVYYRVRRGDTLSEIAVKYRTSVSRLRRWNGLKSGSVLHVGKRLKVGVRRGLVWQEISPHTQVRVPGGYNLRKPRSRTFENDHFRAEIFARRFARGEAVYLELLPQTRKDAKAFPAGFSLSYDGKKVPLSRTSFGYSGLFALPPGKAAGRYRLVINADHGGDKGTESKSYVYNLPVAETRFRTHTRRVYLGNYDRPKPELTPEQKQAQKEKWDRRRKLISESSAKKREVFGIWSDNSFSNRLSHPRNLHKITSPFYTKRRTVQWYRKGGKKHFKKPRVRYHEGTDLRGRWGDPIYAMADGKVVCAQRMYFEGNFIVIDHGQGVFTGYMHLSKFNIREGATVQAGQLLGKAGATGATRGAHLHLNLWIRGVPVEPLSLLSLPIRR